jgi:hypothetical protein
MENIILSKAISSIVLVLIGIILNNPFFLMGGAIFGIAGLSVFIGMVRSEGLESTLSKLRSALKDC